MADEFDELEGLMHSIKEAEPALDRDVHAGIKKLKSDILNDKAKQQITHITKLNRELTVKRVCYMLYEAEGINPYKYWEYKRSIAEYIIDNGLNDIFQHQLDELVKAHLKDLTAGTWIPSVGETKGIPQPFFEEHYAIAYLLYNDVLIMGPGKDGTLQLAVQCNDVFMWGCSDATLLPYDELENVWDHYQKDPQWGVAVWCMKKEKLMPQKPVEDAIRKAGIWDIDSMNLRPNPSSVNKVIEQGE